MTESLRVLALAESNRVTGPAKNLLQFGQLARQGVGGIPIDLEIAVFWRPHNPTEFVDRAAAAGITVHRIAESGRFDRGVMPALRDLLERMKPDILQTHSVKSHFLARFGGFHRGYRWLAYHHGYTHTDWLNRAYNQLDRWSLRAARRVVTMNDAFRAELMARGVERRRIAVIHNAIDPSYAVAAREPAARAALRARLGIGDREPVLLIAARLSKEKDHATLLRALSALRDRYGLKPRLIVLGDGPERARIEAGIQRLGLGGQVVLPGWLPSEPFYGMADIAVLSSLTEGSPNAVLEAMGAGVPLVATAVGGIPEMVSDGESALLVPAGDADKMADALRAVLTSPDLAARLAARGHEIASQKYSPRARVTAICELYRALIEEPGR